MSRQEYINTAVQSAKRYIARGTDAQGNKIRSAAAYMDGTIVRAGIRYDNRG